MIPRHCDPMWEDAWTPDHESIASILCAEAITRIIEPTLNRYENTVANAWWALCDAHLPAEQREIARTYHRLMDDAPCVHSSTVTAVVLAMVEGMRGGIDLTLTMETIFQNVCAAGGIGSVEEAVPLVEGHIIESRLAEFRTLFPDVALTIGPRAHQGG